MKKYILTIIFALSVFLIVVSPAVATTFTTTDEIYWYAVGGNNNVPFTGCYSDPSGFGPVISAVYLVNTNFDSNTSIKVEFSDSSDTLISSTTVSANGTQTITAPTGTYYIDFYGTCSDNNTPTPQPWSYISQMTDSSSNVWTFANPGPPSSGTNTDVVNAINQGVTTIVYNLGTINTTLGNGINTLHSDLGTLNTSVANIYNYFYNGASVPSVPAVPTINNPGMPSQPSLAPGPTAPSVPTNGPNPQWGVTPAISDPGPGVYTPTGVPQAVYINPSPGPIPEPPMPTSITMGGLTSDTPTTPNPVTNPNPATAPDAALTPGAPLTPDSPLSPDAPLTPDSPAPAAPVAPTAPVAPAWTVAPSWTVAPAWTVAPPWQVAPQHF